jgi:hypothetical protein
MKLVLAILLVMLVFVVAKGAYYVDQYYDGEGSEFSENNNELLNHRKNFKIKRERKLKRLRSVVESKNNYLKNEDFMGENNILQMIPSPIPPTVSVSETLDNETLSNSTLSNSTSWQDPVIAWAKKHNIIIDRQGVSAALIMGCISGAALILLLIALILEIIFWCSQRGIKVKERFAFLKRTPIKKK